MLKLGIHILKNKNMIATHTIQNITFNKDVMSIIIDGNLIQVALEKVSTRLKEANDMQRNFYKISPSGYGIHWPLIDEDLSVDALLKQTNH